MIPFRPTIERVWMSMNDLRFERRSENDYVIHMDYDLWADLVRDPQWHPTVVEANTRTWSIFGLPVEIDPSLPRGWVSLRHEVTR